MAELPATDWIDGALAELKSVTVARERYVSAWLGIFIYDLLATLPQEQKYIWTQKVSWIKVLYLLTRYVALLHGVFSASMIFASVSAAACEKVWWFEVDGGLLIVYFSALILAVRVYAIYARSRSILLLLLVLLAGEAVMFIYCATLVQEIAVIINFHGCLASGRRVEDEKIGGAVFIAPLIFDSVVLILTLRRSISLKRLSGSHFPLVSRIVSTGTFYFAVITASNLVNVVIFSLPSTSPSLKSFHLAGSEALTAIASCRLVFSLFSPPTPTPLLRDERDFADADCIKPSVSSTRSPRSFGGVDENGIQLDAMAAAPARIAQSASARIDDKFDLSVDPEASTRPFGDVLPEDDDGIEAGERRGTSIRRVKETHELAFSKTNSMASAAPGPPANSPPGAPPSDFGSLESLRHITTARQRYISAWIAIFMFDLLALLPDERKYIWQSKKWTPLKVLYLLSRYVALVHQVFSSSMVFFAIPASVCEKAWWFEPVGGMIIVYLSAIIMSVRVSAIYDRNIRVIGIWSAPLSFDLVILLFTTYRCLAIAEVSGHQTSLVRKILSTGVFYFAVITASNLVNVILTSLPDASPSLKTFHTAASDALTSIMCSRLVLSLFSPTSMSFVSDQVFGSRKSDSKPSRSTGSSSGGGGQHGSREPPGIELEPAPTNRVESPFDRHGGFVFNATAHDSTPATRPFAEAVTVGESRSGSSGGGKEVARRHGIRVTRETVTS
ncbi:hypothetical protein JCM11491_005761 [Sporobolomyces phaffii]